MCRWRLLVLVLPVVLALGCRKSREETGLQIASVITGGQIRPADGDGGGGIESSVTGTIHSVGGDLGTWDATLTNCQSGERNGFYGADFSAAGSTDLRLRYVHDEAAGDVVKVLIPGKDGEALRFDREASCTKLEGSVQKTNISTWTPKGTIRHVKGHVNFDCTHSNGAGHVTGSVTFANCH